MKVTFSAKDRAILINNSLIPVEGGRTETELRSSILQKVDFSEEEEKEFSNLLITSKKLLYHESVFDLENAEVRFLKNCINQKENDRKLTEHILDVEKRLHAAEEIAKLAPSSSNPNAPTLATVSDIGNSPEIPKID